MMTVEDTAVVTGTETTGMTAGAETTDMTIDGKEAEGRFLLLHLSTWAFR
jgi:hypothetical protein